MDNDRENASGQKFNKEGLLRVGRAGLTRGVGAAGREAAELAAGDITRRAAKKTADRITRRKGVPEKEPTKKMDGAGFYVILLITIIEDLLDVFLSFVTPITSLLVFFIVFVYLYAEKVDMNSRTVVRWIISFIIELIPILNILPTTSIVFALTKTVENNEKIKKAANTLQTKKLSNPNITRAKRG